MVALRDDRSHQRSTRRIASPPLPSATVCSMILFAHNYRATYVLQFLNCWPCNCHSRQSLSLSLSLSLSPLATAVARVRIQCDEDRVRLVFGEWRCPGLFSENGRAFKRYGWRNSRPRSRNSKPSPRTGWPNSRPVIDR